VGKPAQAVEVTEELVSAVNEVHDHFGSMLDLLAAASKAVTASLCVMPQGGDPSATAKKQQRNNRFSFY